MSALAEAPLRRRALERSGMTPEQELELLIQEQAADDTYFVRKAAGECQLDGGVSELVGVTYDFDSFDSEAQGEVISYLPREEDSLFSSHVKHGLRSTYTNLKCKCVACRAAESAYQRERRAAAKARAEA
jgi:hypothetical protein